MLEVGVAICKVNIGRDVPEREEKTSQGLTQSPSHLTHWTVWLVPPPKDLPACPLSFTITSGPLLDLNHSP